MKLESKMNKLKPASEVWGLFWRKAVFIWLYFLLKISGWFHTFPNKSGKFFHKLNYDQVITHDILYYSTIACVVGVSKGRKKGKRGCGKEPSSRALSPHALISLLGFKPLPRRLKFCWYIIYDYLFIFRTTIVVFLLLTYPSP